MARPRVGERKSQLKSVDRTLRALSLFSPERPTWSLSGIALRLSLAKSTAHRLLTTLEARGYLVYDPGRREYRPSLTLVRLAQAAVASLDLRRIARRRLMQLVRDTGESAFLLVAEEQSAIVIDVVESGHPLRLTLPVGTPWPLHAGASDLVLLAHLPDEAIEQYLAGPLRAITPATTTDPEALRRRLARIRRQGYAYTVGELTPDVAAAAVPVLAGGVLVAGLAVAGPASRFAQRRVPQIVEALRSAAGALARDVTGQGAPGAGTVEGRPSRP